MKQRRLGSSGERVSALGLGCMSMSGTYGPVDETEALKTINRALDLGVNLLDSADAYGRGHNEELIAKVLGTRRGEVFLATKFGNTPDGVKGSPDYVRQACEASLTRLGVDVIDLYYQHRVDDKVPIEETVGAMARLVEEGKVRYLGLCEALPETIRRAQATHPLAAVQSEHSLMYPEIGNSTLPVCRELDICFVAYSPLGRSFLTGAVQSLDDFLEGDRRVDHPRFHEVNFEKNVRLVRRVAEIARDKGVKPSQLVLAWLLAQGEDIVPIPGTKRVAFLEENLGALDVSLGEEEMRRIEAAMPPGEVAGNRYPDGQMRVVQR